MDYSRNAPDTVASTVKADSNPFSTERVVMLTETGDSTSVFTGEIGTMAGLPRCDGGILGVYSQTGAVITATYSELAPLNTQQATASLTPTWPGILTINQTLTWLNATINVQIVDRDLISVGNRVVSFTATSSNAIPSIALTATGSNSETYTGTLDITNVSFPTREPIPPALLRRLCHVRCS